MNKEYIAKILNLFDNSGWKLFKEEVAEIKSEVSEEILFGSNNKKEYNNFLRGKLACLITLEEWEDNFKLNVRDNMESSFKENWKVDEEISSLVPDK